MSIGELVFWYASVFFALLALLIFALARHKAAGKIVLPQPDWGFIRDWLKQLDGELWLKIFITATIVLSAGVIITVFVLPYGTALALAALLATLLGLVFFVAKLLA